MAFQDYFFYSLLAYLSILGILFFFDERGFNKVIVIALLTILFSHFFNDAITEMISSAIFNGEYNKQIYTIIFITVFLIAHFIAIKKDWIFSKDID